MQIGKVDGPVGILPRDFFGGLAQLARALDLHSRGQGFDSLILHVFFVLRCFLCFPHIRPYHGARLRPCFVWGLC